MLDIILFCCIGILSLFVIVTTWTEKQYVVDQFRNTDIQSDEQKTENKQRKNETRNEKRRGFIHLILGNMFSGKTEELLRLVRRARIAKKRCLLIRFSQDNRYSKVGVASHAKRTDDDCFSCTTPEEIDKLLKSGDYQQLFVDEFPFFAGIADYAKKWALEDGLTIHMAGLDAYSNQTLWHETEQLIPWADTYIKLSAICFKCGEDAPMTKDLFDRNDGKARIQIGGEEKYRASCRYCLLEDD